MSYTLTEEFASRLIREQEPDDYCEIYNVKKVYTVFEKHIIRICDIILNVINDPTFPENIKQLDKDFEKDFEKDNEDIKQQGGHKEFFCVNDKLNLHLFVYECQSGRYYRDYLKKDKSPNKSPNKSDNENDNENGNEHDTKYRVIHFYTHNFPTENTSMDETQRESLRPPEVKDSYDACEDVFGYDTWTAFTVGKNLSNRIYELFDEESKKKLHGYSEALSSENNSEEILLFDLNIVFDTDVNMYKNKYFTLDVETTKRIIPIYNKYVDYDKVMHFIAKYCFRICDTLLSKRPDIFRLKNETEVLTSVSNSDENNIDDNTIPQKHELSLHKLIDEYNYADISELYNLYGHLFSEHYPYQYTRMINPSYVDDILHGICSMFHMHISE